MAAPVRGRVRQRLGAGEQVGQGAVGGVEGGDGGGTWRSGVEMMTRVAAVNCKRLKEKDTRTMVPDTVRLDFCHCTRYKPNQPTDFYNLIHATGSYLNFFFFSRDSTVPFVLFPSPPLFPRPAEPPGEPCLMIACMPAPCAVTVAMPVPPRASTPLGGGRWGSPWRRPPFFYLLCHGFSTHCTIHPPRFFGFLPGAPSNVADITGPPCSFAAMPLC